MGALVQRHASMLVSIAAVAAALVGWGIWSSGYDPLLLPTPGKVLGAAQELWDDGRLQDDIWISLQRVFKGWYLG